MDSSNEHELMSIALTVKYRDPLTGKEYSQTAGLNGFPANQGRIVIESQKQLIGNLYTLFRSATNSHRMMFNISQQKPNDN